MLVPWKYHMFTAYGYSMVLNVLVMIDFLKTKKLSLLNAILLILFSGWLCFFNLNYISNTLSAINFIVFFILINAYYFYRKKWVIHLSTLTLTIQLITFPLISSIAFYQYAAQTRIIQMPIVSFLKNNAYHKPVYFLESILNYEYPTAEYAGAIDCARLPYLIWMPAYL